MKVSFRHATFIVLMFLLSLAGVRLAGAAEAKYFDATDFVSPRSDLTYADLALQFSPGLGKTPASGTDISRLPNLGGSDYPTAIANPSLGTVRRLDIRLDGKPAMLLMFDLGQSDDSVASVNILSLYDMSSKPRLLDAMNVGLDRETSFLEAGYLKLSPKFGMAFVRNSHHNAGEEYLQTSLIGIWDGKLHEVDTVGSYSWMSGDEDTRVTPSFAAVKNAIAVDATFSVRITRCGGNCEPDVDYPSEIEDIRARYDWNPEKGKFVRPEHAFDKVPQANMEE